ncbi:MAG: DUF4397 domain-containing protein [Chitinophagaceae bacterium]|nr:DUF4397 domain-containing protein [Chitinophagaceae bacterium]
MRKYVILCCSLWLMACAKVKTDMNLPVLNTLKTSNSSIRLITLMGPNKVTAVVGGLSFNLTPNNAPGNTGSGCTVGDVTAAFRPTPVSIPQKVLDQAGIAHIRMSIGKPVFNGSGFAYTLFYSDTVLPDNPNSPTDYYIMPATKTWEEVNYTITAVPRSATPPTVPSNIRIRVVNMASQADTFQRTGPLTLTYGDGTTPVSTLTTNIPSGVASGYVEIPYNTYQFRLFTQTGVEVPESIPGSSTATFHQYQPGGVYTLFVNSNFVFLLGGCNGINVTGNCYSIIPDVNPPVNTSFGLVQFVNTIPGTTYSLNLDNTTIGSAVPFRGVSGYQTMSLGDYSMRLTDRSGQTVAQQNIKITPNDNFTVWSYVKNGQPALSITASDLSTPNGLTVRFMNFSLNVPYITFTYNGQVLPVSNPSNQATYYPDINDTTSAAGASQNLAIGVPATHLPYSGIGQFPLQVNKSDAGPPPFVPGIPLISVRPLQAGDFTAQSVYTVALTGFVDTTLGENPAIDTLLIVKHFK